MCHLAATFQLKCQEQQYRQLLSHMKQLKRVSYKEKQLPVCPSKRHKKKTTTTSQCQCPKSDTRSMIMYYLAQKLLMTLTKAWPFKQKKMQQQPCTTRKHSSLWFDSEVKNDDDDWPCLILIFSDNQKFSCRLLFFAYEDREHCEIDSRNIHSVSTIIIWYRGIC